MGWDGVGCVGWGGLGWGGLGWVGVGWGGVGSGQVSPGSSLLKELHRCASPSACVPSGEPRHPLVPLISCVWCIGGRVCRRHAVGLALPPPLGPARASDSRYLKDKQAYEAKQKETFGGFFDQPAAASQSSPPQPAAAPAPQAQPSPAAGPSSASRAEADDADAHAEDFTTPAAAQLPDAPRAFSPAVNPGSESPIDAKLEREDSEDSEEASAWQVLKAQKGSLALQIGACVLVALVAWAAVTYGWFDGE
jgi:hypothetical protein